MLVVSDGESGGLWVRHWMVLISNPHLYVDFYTNGLKPLLMINMSRLPGHRMVRSPC